VRTFGPDAASCEVLVYREGALSAFGHDLVLRVHAFEIAVETPPAVRARFDPASLRVAAALRDGRPVPGAPSADDAQDIERTIREKVLKVERFPEIRFASSAVSSQGAERDVRGVLTLCGTSREIAFTARPDGERLTAEVWLHQPDFGIRPYSAFLGALRVKADVLVRVAVPK
jgi:polyisoprenoid-binding protein YceI